MINILTALPCEARTLIDGLRLQKRTEVHAFSLFSNKEHNKEPSKEPNKEPNKRPSKEPNSGSNKEPNKGLKKASNKKSPSLNSSMINLIVSGPGGLAAATATAYLQGLQGTQPSAAWLNIGIAGSRAFEIGDAVLAQRIIDNTTGQRFYPGLCFPLPLSSTCADVVSVTSPEANYPTSSVYDMEAAGFYSAALRFTTSELIHSLKIISDNPARTVDKIDEKVVVELMTQRLPEIQQLIEQLDTLANELVTINKAPDSYEMFTSRWRFTVSQQHVLKSLLWRWQTLSSQDVENAIDITQFRNGDQVLRYLEQQLASMPIRFHNPASINSTASTKSQRE